MCSLEDEYNDSDGDVPDVIKDISADILCRKCKCEDVDILLVGQSGYCKKCFLIATNHKFRAALGKSKIIHHGDLVLVDYAGDLNSTVLLHLIKTCMSEPSHKKLIFNTMILYIDAIDETNEDRNILKHKIIEQTKSFGFDCYVVSLSQALNKEDTLDIKSIDKWTNNVNDKQLHEILGKLVDDTSRIDLLKQLRRKLLVSAARKLNCNKIFVADSTTDIAANVLGNTCLGRGAQLSTFASFCDARCADMKILKPIRDFTQQELLYYVQCHALNPVKMKITTDTTTQPATSIQALAHNFTTGLESQFSNTVSTIFRTAEKLSARSHKDNQEVETNCVLCDVRLDLASSNGEVSALRAIKVSKLVSAKNIRAKTSFDKESNCTSSSNNQKCSNDDADECGCKDSKSRQITSEDIQKCLCYSCKLIFWNSDILSTFPASLLLEVQQRLALESMRKEIDDFLL